MLLKKSSSYYAYHGAILVNAHDFNTLKRRLQLALRRISFYSHCI